MEALDHASAEHPAVPEAIAAGGEPETPAETGEEVADALKTTLGRNIKKIGAAVRKQGGGTVQAYLVEELRRCTPRPLPQHPGDMLEAATGKTGKTARITKSLSRLANPRTGPGQPFGKRLNIPGKAPAEPTDFSQQVDEESIERKPRGSRAGKNLQLAAKPLKPAGTKVQRQRQDSLAAPEGRVMHEVAASQVSKHSGREGYIHNVQRLRPVRLEPVPVARPHEDQITPDKRNPAAVDPVQATSFQNNEKLRKVVAVHRDRRPGSRAVMGQMQCRTPGTQAFP